MFASGTNLIFKESVSRTNITVHILKLVTVMNQDTLHNFPQVPLQHHCHTQDVSQTVWSDLIADALRYLYVYRISTVCILVSDGGQAWVHIYLRVFIIQRPHITPILFQLGS